MSSLWAGSTERPVLAPLPDRIAVPPAPGKVAGFESPTDRATISRRPWYCRSSRADQILFTSAGFEQASSGLTARSRHAAARFARTHFTVARIVADLCCGFGSNLAALAGARRRWHGGGAGGVGVVGGDPRVPAVNADLTSLQFARHNVSVCAPAAAPLNS